MTDADTLRSQVRDHYAAAAAAAATASADDPCCAPASGCGTGEGTTTDALFGSPLYGRDVEGLPVAAVRASMGCGNPLLVAELHEGERVLDLGSGGGIDVLLSARRVGPSGFAHGVDMTQAMLDLARRNAAEAGATNVAFHEGTIEDLPLPDASVDVVISNCVLNLRVLAPGGRLGVSDVVAEDRISPTERAERGSHVGCIAGALSRQEYVDLLLEAGFVTPEVTFTHEVADGLHGAVVRAAKP
jgi:SAM-dependent methyltransferase